MRFSQRLGSMAVVVAFVVSLPGCANRRGGGDNDPKCDPVASDCPDGQVCERYADGELRCSVPVTIVGHVITTADGTPIEGAIVQAVDINGAAVGTSAVTGADGTYTLTVPASRDEAGAPAEGIYTLRAQAAGFQEFPTAVRPALPIDAATAAETDGVWVIENAITTIALIALPGDTATLGSIAGTVDAPQAPGVLVVASGPSGAFVGYSDASGAYVIFNVPAGTYSVEGYAAGVQLESQRATVAKSEALTGVDLRELDEPLSIVSGNVQIVNAPGGSVTSVVLAVESTFVESVGRGQVPPGLRIGGVSGAFAIEHVPNGQYVVLAAFENDDLVRDPDENISGTQIVHIQVPDPASGNLIALSDGFKITGALGVIEPGAEAPQAVSTPSPMLVWEDDSSEDGYTIRVYDAFGTQLWDTEIGSVSGSAQVSVAYGGPPLEAGMFYQFRVTSFRERSGSRSAISTSEDLKGVFSFAGG